MSVIENSPERQWAEEAVWELATDCLESVTAAEPEVGHSSAYMTLDATMQRLYGELLGDPVDVARTSERVLCLLYFAGLYGAVASGIVSGQHAKVTRLLSEITMEHES